MAGGLPAGPGAGEVVQQGGGVDSFQLSCGQRPRGHRLGYAVFEKALEDAVGPFGVLGPRGPDPDPYFTLREVFPVSFAPDDRQVKSQFATFVGGALDERFNFP